MRGQGPWTGAALVAALGLAGCGGHHTSAADGGPDGCWPVESSTPAGTVELGSAQVSSTANYEPMPDSIPFYPGGQGGTFLLVDARIKGLEPGDPTNFLDPSNPRTKFTATLDDGTVVGTDCPGTVGYVPQDGDYYERAKPQQIAFLPYSLGEQAFNTQIQIKVEVIDAAGHYAMDEKSVFATAPEGYADAGPLGGGGDAGPDAGPDGGL